MHTKNLEPGSSAWVDDVFSLPPARNIRGRSKNTHRHVTFVEHLNCLTFVESRNELIGLLALEYLHKIGSVRRFKSQAFEAVANEWQIGGNTDLKIDGTKYTPDFIAQDVVGKTHVIEIKSARFITRAIEEKLEAWKSIFLAHDLNFSLWTDQNVLDASLRNNLLRMRRAAVDPIAPHEITSLVEILRDNGPMPVWALYSRDLDVDLIAHAAWKGKVFFPMQIPLSAQTMISLKKTEDLSSVLFGRVPDMNAWWNALEAA